MAKTIEQLDELHFREFCDKVPFVGLVSRAFEREVRQVVKLLDSLTPKQKDRWLARQDELLDPGSPYYLTVEQRTRVNKIIARVADHPVGQMLAETEAIEDVTVRWMFHRYARPGMIEDL
jgi:hypothetical protein